VSVFEKQLAGDFVVFLIERAAGDKSFYRHGKDVC
jgi:hypothetical protein